MPDELVSLTIDGVPVSVPKGTLVIEAAKQAGVLVPHYCYHPGLPVAGLCRMCLVEIEQQPKLAIACATQAAEGMVSRLGAGAGAGRRGTAAHDQRRRELDPGWLITAGWRVRQHGADRQGRHLVQRLAHRGQPG